MKITIEASADNEIRGNGWTCYYTDILSCSAVFSLLRDFISRNRNLEFYTLKEIMTQEYKNRTVKSKADIYNQIEVIEICKPNKTLPNIWIINDLHS